MNELQPFFSLLNQYFDKIYVITLHRATDRQAHIQRELQGLQYDFFWGKDKQEFSVEELQQKGLYNEEEARLHHRYGKAMQIGQICCSLSHAEVYRDIVANNHQKVLIMEDDVVIDREGAKKFPQILTEVPADWQVLYLGFAEREKAPGGIVFKRLFYHFLRLFGAIRFTHKMIGHLYPKKISEHIYRAGYHDCIHAYAVTNLAAKTLLSLQQPVSFIADNLVAYAVTNGLLRGYVILPKIIYQQYQVGTSSASYLND
jgi:glycosyl transferase, family 25